MVILTAGSFIHFLVLIIDCSICGSHALDDLCTIIAYVASSGSESWDKYIATTIVAINFKGLSRVKFAQRVLFIPNFTADFTHVIPS